MQDFYFSIGLGLSVGLFLSLILLLAKVLVSKYDMTPYQLNYDSMLILFFIYLPLFLNDIYNNGVNYPDTDFFVISSAQMFGSFGFLFCAIGL